MISQLLRQVRILDPVANCDRVADVLFVDGVIQTIANQIALPETVEVTEAAGWVLGTGLVDLYSHSGQPGFESRETLESLLQAATAGGFTRLTLLPDTYPAIDHPAGLEQLRTQAKSLSAVTQLSYWGALTVNVEGKQMTELAELAAAGVVGFADGQPLQNFALIRRLLEYVQPLRKPIALWCCDRNLTGNGIVREGVQSMRLGLPGSLAIAETTALAALLECVEEIGTPVHLMRISTARSVELIRAAKARKLPITASTTWMHLLLSTESLYSYDPSLRLDPPLGNPIDQIALIEAVQQGVIDVIAIDHTPYTYEEKTVAFAESPPGAIGLDLALPLLWQAFVASGQWSALTLWRCLSSNPALCLQQNPATLAPGQPTECLLFDPQQCWQVDRHSLKSQSSNTPWQGQEIRGRVVRVWRG
jgi:dihydroorotase